MEEDSPAEERLLAEAAGGVSKSRRSSGGLRRRKAQRDSVKRSSSTPEAMAQEATSSDEEEDEDSDSKPLIAKEEPKPAARRRRKKKDGDDQEAWWKLWPDKKRSAPQPPPQTRVKEDEAEPKKSAEEEAARDGTEPAEEEAPPEAKEVIEEDGNAKEGGRELWPDEKSESREEGPAPEEGAPVKPLKPAEDYTLADFLKDARAEYRRFVADHPADARRIRLLRNRCLGDLILIAIFCGLGAFAFKFTEGSFESFYKCGVKRVKRDFVDELWRSSHFMKEDEWKSRARRKLMDFENQLHEAFDAGMTTYSGQRSWSFLNSVIYAFTVISTIGYGHIAPSTTTGRALTIVYAIFGIPLFLILLADFGKMFTRGIKWIWAFVRRLYYTGSCKKVRRTGPVKEVMKGVQVMYDMATFRRPSQVIEVVAGEVPPPPGSGEPPSTPAPSNFAIDDEFNIPITVAITILLIYIFCGAIVFYIWEESWSFFESFYFVFISMSTIGFGDFVPQNKMYMMASIVYLAFGLALTTMCINVVQEKLSDTFRQATAKIGATIGLKVSEEDGTVTPATPANVELAQVHKSPSQTTT